MLEKIRKKLFLFVCLILCLGVTGCIDKVKEKDNEVTAVPTINAAKADIESGRKSCGSNKPGNQRGADIAITPAANQASVDENNPLDIVITGNVNERIHVNDSLNLITSIEDLIWIDQDQLAVICHINPSLQCLLIYSLKTKDFVAEKYGIDFTWRDKDIKTLIYIRPKPHFSDSGTDMVKNYEDQKLFEAPEGIRITDIEWKNDNQIRMELTDKEGRVTEKLLRIE